MGNWGYFQVHSLISNIKLTFDIKMVMALIEFRHKEGRESVLKIED
jgi:hypothetical protein